MLPSPSSNQPALRCGNASGRNHATPIWSCFR